MITGSVAPPISSPSSDAVDQDGDSSIFLMSAGVWATVMGVSSAGERLAW